MADQYVVIQRGGKWWITVDGERRGPFERRKDAIELPAPSASTSERGRGFMG